MWGDILHICIETVHATTVVSYMNFIIHMVFIFMIYYPFERYADCGFNIAKEHL